MKVRCLLVALLVAADAVAIWIGLRSAPNTSFLLLLAAASAVIAVVRRPATAASVTLALVVPMAFLALMAGPAHCDGSVARVAGVLVVAHSLVLGLAMAGRLASPRATR